MEIIMKLPTSVYQALLYDHYTKYITPITNLTVNIDDTKVRLINHIKSAYQNHRAELPVLPANIDILVNPDKYRPYLNSEAANDILNNKCVNDHRSFKNHLLPIAYPKAAFKPHSPYILLLIGVQQDKFVNLRIVVGSPFLSLDFVRESLTSVPLVVSAYISSIKTYASVSKFEALKERLIDPYVGTSTSPSVAQILGNFNTYFDGAVLTYDTSKKKVIPVADVSSSALLVHNARTNTTCFNITSNFFNTVLYPQLPNNYDATCIDAIKRELLITGTPFISLIPMMLIRNNVTSSRLPYLNTMYLGVRGSGKSTIIENFFRILFLDAVGVFPIPQDKFIKDFDICDFDKNAIVHIQEYTSSTRGDATVKLRDKLKNLTGGNVYISEKKGVDGEGKVNRANISVASNFYVAPIAPFDIGSRAFFTILFPYNLTDIVRKSDHVDAKVLDTLFHDDLVVSGMPVKSLVLKYFMKKLSPIIAEFDVAYSKLQPQYGLVDPYSLFCIMGLHEYYGEDTEEFKYIVRELRALYYEPKFFTLLKEGKKEEYNELIRKTYNVPFFSVGLILNKVGERGYEKLIEALNASYGLISLVNNALDITYEGDVMYERFDGDFDVNSLYS